MNANVVGGISLCFGVNFTNAKTWAFIPQPEQVVYEFLFNAIEKGSIGIAMPFFNRTNANCAGE